MDELYCHTPVDEQVAVVSEGPDRLAVDDDALLEQLQLRQLLVLPGEPEPEVVVDVVGFVDAALKMRRHL